MNGRCLQIVLVVFLACAFLCCGGASKPATDTTAGEAPVADAAVAETASAESSWEEVLPESIGSTGWVRTPDVSVFAGESLFEYINGAAEMYHKYDFVDLQAAEYAMDDGIVTTDVYKFLTADMAFGMYTTLRPEEPDTVMLGVEGFAFDTNWIYVKGSYLVNVYTYNAEIGEVRTIATAIESRLPGTTDRPGAFDVFPQHDRVAYSEKIYAEAFLSRDVLTDVYTIDYEWGDHRFTLFSSDDPGSVKLEAWRAGVEEKHDPDIGYRHLPYDGSRYLHASDPYRGEILAGPIRGKLVGMVGYRPEDMQILLAWLHALAEQP